MARDDQSTSRIHGRSGAPSGMTEIEMVSTISGWLGVVGAAALLAAAAWFFLGGDIFIAMPALLGAFFLFKGVLVLQPNEAVALVLFGEYRATLRRDGFFGSTRFTNGSASP